MAWFPLLIGGCLVAADQPAAVEAPRVELLWPDGAPGAAGQEAADRPSLTIFPAPQPSGTAVVICPGGGYGHLATGHEGHDVARWLNSVGISAFMLQYRIAPRYRHPAPMQDAQRAMRIVRSSAAAWGLDPKRIGILGFSAGGHLASTAGTHFDEGAPDAADPVDRASCRPDFMILVYPVITFTEAYMHKGSRSNLLGRDPEPALFESLSNEKQVTAQTPPTFLVHTSGDKGVPAENSVAFYLALRKAGVPAEMHIFEKGNHGFGLGPGDPILSTWPDACVAWMRSRGLLK